jgi:sec-independent protein translocase protein TatA
MEPGCTLGSEDGPADNLPLNGDDMFDLSPAHILILLLVVILLFGSRRLPGAAKSLGESMHIFKKSVSGLNEDGTPKDPQAPATTATAQPAAQPQAALPPAAPAAPAYDGATAQQLADLQKQVAELQKQNAAAGSSSGDGSGQQPF